MRKGEKFTKCSRDFIIYGPESGRLLSCTAQYTMNERELRKAFDRIAAIAEQYRFTIVESAKYINWGVLVALIARVAVLFFALGILLFRYQEPRFVGFVIILGVVMLKQLSLVYKMHILEQELTVKEQAVEDMFPPQVTTLLGISAIYAGVLFVFDDEQSADVRGLLVGLLFTMGIFLLFVSWKELVNYRNKRAEGTGKEGQSPSQSGEEEPGIVEDMREGFSSGENRGDV